MRKDKQMVTDTVVLIPHYNNLTGLRASLASITAEYPVEVVIVDDGSQCKPDAAALTEQFSHLAAVHLLSLERNVGIEHALNHGLTFIVNQRRFRYVARLDAGDICLPSRFRLQRDFLETQQEVYLLGCNVEMVDTENKRLYQVSYPCDIAQIRNKMYINNMFCHPAVMFRSAVITQLGGYPTEYPYAEDYAFFFNIIEAYAAANLQDVLVRCQVNPEGISLSKRRVQIQSRLRIIRAHWRWNKIAIYGLLRSLLLYCVPVVLVTALKRGQSDIRY